MKNHSLAKGAVTALSLVFMLACSSSGSTEQSETNSISLDACRASGTFTLCNDSFFLFNSVDVKNIRAEKKPNGYEVFVEYRNGGHDKKGFVRFEALNEDKQVGHVISKVFDLEYHGKKVVKAKLPTLGRELRLTTVMWND